jgi:hypothetical protein
MGEAIETTQELYPGLLEHNLNLLFMLKCRQFIEMVNGTDSEVRGPAIRSPKSQGSNRSSPNMSPVHHSLNSARNTPVGSRGSSPNRPIGVKGHCSGSASQSSQTNNQNNCDLKPINEEEMNATNLAMNGKDTPVIENDDVDMCDGVIDDGKHVTNGNSEGLCVNGFSQKGDHCNSEDMGR